MMTATGKIRNSRRKPTRSHETVWYHPTIQDVYAQFKVAETMLCRIPDPELAAVKRQMGVCEDLLWQFTTC